MVYAPSAVVQAPPVRPPVLSLLTAGRLVSESDDRWTAGFAYESEGAGAGRSYDPCAAGSVVSDDSRDGIVSYIPFVIEADDICSGLGSPAHDFEGRATRSLLAVTPKRLEAEFWTGAIATAAGNPNTFLTKAGSVDITPTVNVAVKPRVALAILEDALGSVGPGQQGMVHLTRRTASLMAYGSRCDVDNYTHTEMGNLVVPGVGYPGTGPLGVAAAPGTAWAWATDVVDVRLTPSVVLSSDRIQDADRGVNTIRTVAQRFAAASFDNVRRFAVLVDVTST